MINVLMCMCFSGDFVDGIERESTCELEVDAVASDVLNRLEMSGKIGGNPGLAALWDDERQRRTSHNIEDTLLELPASPGML